MRIIFIFIVMLCALIWHCLAYEECNNAYDFMGVQHVGFCVPVNKCKLYNDLMKLPTRTNEQIGAFKNSSCVKYNKKICCVDNLITTTKPTPTTTTTTSTTTPKPTTTTTTTTSTTTPKPTTTTTTTTSTTTPKPTPTTTTTTSTTTPKPTTTTTTTTSTTTPKPTTTTTLAPVSPISKKEKGYKFLKSFEKYCGDQQISHVIHSSNRNEVQIGQYSWMAAFVSDLKEIKCSGSLISDRHILTAAHCFDRNSQAKVYLGVQNILKNRTVLYGPTEKSKSYFVKQSEVKNITRHPKYDKLQMHYDIALVTLNQTIKFKNHIFPICLPMPLRSKILEEVDTFNIANWKNNVLIKSSVNKSDDCRKIFLQNYKVIDNQICAGGDTLNDACKENSGGPLFSYELYGKQKRFVQYGIDSYVAQTCDRILTPAVYTNVAMALDWIAENIVD